MTQKESSVITSYIQLGNFRNVSKQLKIPRRTVRSILIKYKLITPYKRGKSNNSKVVRLKKPKPVFSSKLSEYNIWAGMIRRCYDTSKDNYHNYGGKGITVYQSWRTSYYLFCLYLNSTIGMRPTLQHTIDRIDNKKNYDPGNLQWLTIEEQTQKKSNNVLDPQLVRYIRQQRDKTNRSIKDVADEIQVSWQNVYAVWKDKTWLNIK